LAGRHGRLALRPAFGVEGVPRFLRLEEVFARVLTQPGPQHLLPLRPDEDDAVVPAPRRLVGAVLALVAAGPVRPDGPLLSRSTPRRTITSPGRMPVSSCSRTIAATWGVMCGRVASTTP